MTDPDPNLGGPRPLVDGYPVDFGDLPPNLGHFGNRNEAVDIQVERLRTQPGVWGIVRYDAHHHSMMPYLMRGCLTETRISVREPGFVRHNVWACWPIQPDELLYDAWCVIANAYDGNWSRASPEWRGAAERWRDNWHDTFPRNLDPGAPDVER